MIRSYTLCVERIDCKMRVGDLVRNKHSPELTGLVTGEPKKTGSCIYVPVYWFYNNHLNEYDTSYVEVISESR